jgi:hypothetical protein
MLPSSRSSRNFLYQRRQRRPIKSFAVNRKAHILAFFARYDHKVCFLREIILFKVDCHLYFLHKLDISAQMRAFCMLPAHLSFFRDEHIQMLQDVTRRNGLMIVNVVRST